MRVNLLQVYLTFMACVQGSALISGSISFFNQIWYVDSLWQEQEQALSVAQPEVIYGDAPNLPSVL